MKKMGPEDEASEELSDQDELEEDDMGAEAPSREEPLSAPLEKPAGSLKRALQGPEESDNEVGGQQDEEEEDGEENEGEDDPLNEEDDEEDAPLEEEEEEPCLDNDEEEEIGGQERQEEEGGEEEEEEDTPLVFDADLPVDPLSLVDHQDEPGHEFERYKKLQYEMLAERKRRTLESGYEPAQKRQRTSLHGADVDDIYGSKGELDQHFEKQEERRRGRRGLERKRGRRPGPRGLPADVTKKLGQANLFYVSEQYQEAVDVLVEVVRMAPNVSDSYHTLGLCHEALGDRRKALNFYMIAAHLTPKDTSLWRRLAAWSTEQNNPAQAIHCLSKVIRWEPNDLNTRWDRAVLMAEVGDFKKAGSEFEKLHAERPADVEVAKMLARMFHKMGHSQKATAVLEEVIQRLPASHVDLTAVNILAELHMEAGAFKSAVAAMTSAREKLGMPLPPDLEVKLGICYAYLGDFESAKLHTEPLRQNASEEWADLFMDVGDAFFAVARPSEALRFYDVLSAFPAYDQPALWLKIGQCQALLGEHKAAVTKLRKVLLEHPDDLDARITLSDALMRLGRFEEGLRVLEPGGHSHQASEEEQSWWESVRVKIMRANFQLAQGMSAAFLEAALPLVEGTIDAEFEARQRRLLAAESSLPTSDAQDPNNAAETPNATKKATGADVFAGYKPVQQKRKRQKTRRERALEKAAAEKRGLDEPEGDGVNGPEGVAAAGVKALQAEAGAVQEGGGDADVSTEALADVIPEEADGQERAEADVSMEEADRQEMEDVDIGLENTGGQERGNADVSREAQADISMEDADRGDDVSREVHAQQTSAAVPIADGFTSGESFQLLYNVVRGLVESGKAEKASGIVQRLLLLGKNAPPGKRLSVEQRKQLKQLTAGVEYRDELPPRERERDSLKNQCKEQPDNIRLWNRFNARAIRSGGYMVHRKWLFQLRVKHPGSVPVAMLCGHQYASSQKFQSALREYQRAHAQRPDEPLISLCIGLAFLHHAMSRRTSHRNRAVLQGFAFLYKYHRLAKGSQEANFNLGRAYHQLGLVHLAVPYYEKALSAGVRPTCSQVEAEKGGSGKTSAQDEKAAERVEGERTLPDDATEANKTDVARSAANNLALIFRRSGAALLADQLRRDYLSPSEET